MPDFKVIDVEAQSYVYTDCKCPMNPPVISQTIGEAFQQVYAFMQENGLTPTGPALTVYYTYNPQTVDFRAGFFVSATDAGKAAGAIKAGSTPAGRVVHFTHKGAYAKLSESYGQLMSWLEKEGLTLGAPTWEVYANDPDVTTEEDLVTEVYVALA